MSRIGFVLLTHADPPQAARLVGRLNAMFGSPPVVCHHDFGKCALPEGLLPPNVEFVRPHLDTAWGDFSLVQATTRALDRMYARPDAPDWCVVLSGAHYPLKPAAQILADLDAGGFDAHIDAVRIGRQFRHTEWYDSYYRRHCVKYIDVRSVDRRLRPRTRRFGLPPPLGALFLPFRPGLLPFGGSQWFTVGRRAARYLLDFQATPAAAVLARRYRDTAFSDEVYFHTILGNAPGLRLNPTNWVYLDWSENEVHPKTLTPDDLAALQSSPAHFARKFDPRASAGLLDALDALIDAPERLNEGPNEASQRPSGTSEKTGEVPGGAGDGTMALAGAERVR